jgi:hypothetical protein
MVQARAMGDGSLPRTNIAVLIHHLRRCRNFATLFDGIAFAAFALVVLAGIPNPRRADAAPASDSEAGFRAVAHDRLLLILIAANIVLVMTGGALFSNILAPFVVRYRAPTSFAPFAEGVSGPGLSSGEAAVSNVG